jgi:Tol biopolymer transport system component
MIGKIGMTPPALPVSRELPASSSVNENAEPQSADSVGLTGLEAFENPDDAVNVLAKRFGYAEFPQVSPDGETIIFNVVGDYTTSQMLSMDMKGKDIRALFTGEPVSRESLPGFLKKHAGKIDEQGTWSHDGRSILYRSNEKGTFGIGRFDLKTGRPELVLHDPAKNLKHPVETHDGYIIGYGGSPSEKYVTSENYSDIYVADPRNHKIRYITSSDGSAAYKHPSEMKGSILAHKELKTPDGAVSDLVLIDPMTGSETNLTGTPGADERHPFYNEKNGLIAFHSDESGDKNLWISNRDCTEKCQLTFYGKAAQSPCWTPDGKKIVFIKKLESVEEGAPFYTRESDIRVIDVRDALKDLAHQAKKRLKSAQKNGMESQVIESARNDYDNYRFFLKYMENKCG